MVVCQRANPPIIGGIGVIAMGIARRAAGFIKGQMIWRPFRFGQAAGENRATVAVVGQVTIIEITFILAEEGQQLGKAPAIIALRGPHVVIFGHTAQKDHGIDRGRATDNFAARHKHRRRIGGAGRLIIPTIFGADAKGTRPQVAGGRVWATVGIINLFGQC